MIQMRKCGRLIVGPECNHDKKVSWGWPSINFRVMQYRVRTEDYVCRTCDATITNREIEENL